MRPFFRFALFITVTFIVLPLSSALADQASPPKGTELLTPFKSQLRQALLAGMADGPEIAIDVCKQQAPKIAGALSVGSVRMGRTSDRLRNPENTAPEWVVPLLQGYLANAADRMPKSVALDGKRSGYVEPIQIQPLCSTCHGVDIAPAIQSKISQLYPADNATGYKVGDLRGVFWVEYADEGDTTDQSADE